MAVIVVNELKKIVEKVSLVRYNDTTTINFIHGDASQTVKKLKDLDKTVRYPCIALLQPFDESTGGEFLSVRIPVLIIATLTDGTLPPNVRYNQTFIPILYPIYEELLIQLAEAPLVNECHPDRIPSRKRDVPGSVPAAADFKDVLDTIELYDLQLDFIN